MSGICSTHVSPTDTGVSSMSVFPSWKPICVFPFLIVVFDFTSTNFFVFSESSISIGFSKVPSCGTNRYVLFEPSNSTTSIKPAP